MYQFITDIRITRDCQKKSLIFDQTKYTSKVVKYFGQENCKETSVPLPTGYILRPNKGKENSSLHSCYQLVIGSLLYIMLGTRPDIAYAMIKMSQYSSNPLEEHLQKAIQIVCYLSHSQSLCIKYSASGTESGLIAYSDTDWTGDVETSCSTTRYAMLLANRIVSWLFRQQKYIRLSFTEAEYCEMTECTKQIQWIQNLFGEIYIPLGCIPMCVDNQRAMFLTSNPMQEDYTKHVWISQHYIHKAVEHGEVELFYITTNTQFTDIFTKNLRKIKFQEGRKMLTLILFPT